jgi:hypothetical protein
MGRIDEAIQLHLKAHEEHKKVAAGDAMQTVARLRLIDGLAQLARAQSEGRRFQDAAATVDSMEAFIQPTDSYSLFKQGREYVFIACKVGQLEEDQFEESHDAVRIACIEKSKSTLAKAAERGFDVITGIERDTAFKNFSKYPECAEVQEWLYDRLGL